MNQLQCVFLSFTLTCGASVCHASTRVEKVSQFENVNNPRIMYWFWDPALLRQDKYLADLDSIAKRSPFDLVFLTARGGLDFYKYETMRPVFTKLLDEAHKRHIKIGLQLWEKSFRNVPTGKCFSTVEEQEVTLDDTGKGILNFTAKHIREKKAQQSMLFKAWAFKKKGDGIYLSGTLQDVTGRMTITTNKPGALTCSIDGGKQLAGYTVYALTKHDYPCGDIYSGYVSSLFKDAFDQYAKIPFDGTALDEYGIINVSPPWIMGKTDTLTERFYSPAMAAQYAKRYGMDMQSSLLTMRYVPDGHEKLRMKSINCYMDLMRNGPLQVEKNFYKDSESAFGHQIFHGVHGTHHNMLLGDELWHTGANWWTLPREYGQSDEITALPTEMGIAQCAQKNILYNMYYNKSADAIMKKATHDLAYGIRTHYHAYNDVQGWGVRLESPEFMTKVWKVENAAALLNRLNPALPQMDVLIVFGIEALQNWFPNKRVCNKYELNSSVNPEAVAMNLWNKGYRVTLVSSDVITEGKLKNGKGGELDLNGHHYDKLVYLYPQYIKHDAFTLLDTYQKQHGKLVMCGEYGKDFYGEDISKQIAKLGYVCKDTSELSDCLRKMGAAPCILPKNASVNEDGSYVETFYPQLIDNSDVTFSAHVNGNDFSGDCQGMIGMQADSQGHISKLVASGLSVLKRNGIEILRLSSPSDIWITKDQQDYQIQVLKGTQVVLNKL